MKTRTIKVALLSICFIVLSIGVFAQSCTISCYSKSLRRYDVNIYLYEYSPINWFLALHETYFATTDAQWIPSLHVYYYTKNVDLSDMPIPGNLFNATFYLQEIQFTGWHEQRSVTSAVFNFEYYYTNNIVLPVIDLTSVPAGGGGVD